ncbi:hypothetical protein CERZMDRAFT_47485, partial [Cercospora zeae-maydis SCOH1-5]
PFLDDIAIYGLKTKYSNKEVKPRLCRFIVEHIRNLDKVLADLKRVGLIIVGYVTNKYSRYLDAEQVAKLIK